MTILSSRISKPEEEDPMPKSASPNAGVEGDVPVEDLIKLDADDDFIFEDFARLRLKGDGEQ